MDWVKKSWLPLGASIACGALTACSQGPDMSGIAAERLRSVQRYDISQAMASNGKVIVAGTQSGGVLTIATQALVDAVNIKVGGFLRLVRAVDEHLLPNSRLVAIGGHYGFEPTAYAAAAGVGNAALVNVVRQMSLAYGERGITAHLVAPGPADTERLRRVAADRAKMLGTTVEAVLDTMRAESSLGAFTEPGQVAWALEMLLAPEASAMTGSSLMLDAGRRRGLP